MKKTIFSFLLIISAFILFGCGKNMTPSEAVKEYLNRYVTLDDSIMEQLDEFVNGEKFDENQKKTYKEILRKQYSSLTYTIVDEKIEEDIAYVNVKIDTIDLHKAQKEAEEYLEAHKDEFNNEEGLHDEMAFLNYKLKLMKEATDTTTHEIEIKVVKEDDEWVVSQLSNDDLQKIHGIYEIEE